MLSRRELKGGRGRTYFLVLEASGRGQINNTNNVLLWPLQARHRQHGSRSRQASHRPCCRRRQGQVHHHPCRQRCLNRRSKVCSRRTPAQHSGLAPLIHGINVDSRRSSSDHYHCQGSGRRGPQDFFFAAGVAGE
ncbi:hypothetical protein NCU08017 [Neurospora crassa OR74A]|uniref:Uncharacterized protein n=1 Tax=Neurospora crassa (strain ATCC 24698 / 74-OR23-1A / CBS 708.71 / DSM 1257 / FGSC 987) TaxID=367110 RepID=Q7SAM4_NEUCR|nr:hypothetical protein NCU08017 [Neurospora crassa OR74A]EAA33451.2 hypothetical protein NCU08017 [Neurospora crassa OR74A]|eukprot:XP_962687.2 hypothetical protein NCU08017 [Neurospora crassa OR74A]